MGFKFQKRIKLMPGITFNLSKKGVSTSFGKTGARITLGHGQTRITTGLPGSGISHTSISTDKKSSTNIQSEKLEFLELPADPTISRQRAGQIFFNLLGVYLEASSVAKTGQHPIFAVFLIAA